MSLALRGGKVWNGFDGKAREGTLVVDEGLIAGTGGDAGASTTLDVSGCTVLPGLIEGHAHLCFNAQANWREVFDTDSPARMAMRMAAAGSAMLRAGITTVRDLGAPTELAIEVREAFAVGIVPGPSLLVSGAPITTTGGHCWFMGGEADGELGVRVAVRERVKAGCDWIKVMATGGNMTHGTNTFEAQYQAGELAAIVIEAHRLGRKVAAHAHGAKGIAVAVEAGVDMVEHCTFSVPGGMDFDPGVAKQMAAKGIVVSPTVSVGFRRWPDDGRRENRAKILKGVLAAGCRVLMSTDCGIPNVPHEALAEGMSVMEELTGLEAVEVLKLATSGAAQLLELKDRGVIADGKRADLVVVDGDPTQDLGALERVRYVLKEGEVVVRR